MHTQTALLARPDDGPVDPWAFLTGGSVGIVIGFAVDLLRLGLHQVRPALVAARASSPRFAARGWRCSDPCDAGAR